MGGRLDRPRDYEAEQRRKRLLLGVGLLVVLLAIIAYFALRSDGEDSRAQYCTKLQAFNTSAGLEQELRRADRAELDAITAVAPRAVYTAWSDASTYVLDPSTPSPSGVDAALVKFQSDLDVIQQDAADNCSLPIAR